MKKYKYHKKRTGESRNEDIYFNSLPHPPSYYHSNLMPREEEVGGHIYGELEDYTTWYKENKNN